jgi:bifunctional oligoribonuclease and PAP phosphatase NrnA
MRGTEHWDALREVIEQTDRFLLTTHTFPEGDAIGSEVALALYLQSLGKQVVVLNDSPPLERYQFLTRHFPVLSWHDAGAWPDPGWVQVAICLDVSTWEYLGPIGRWIRGARPFVISIDHHNVKAPFGDLDVVVSEAAATGEILYRFFKAVNAHITRPLAEALYSSILFDTQGFRLPNTTNEALCLAAEILEYGVDHRRICADLFETDTFAKLELTRLTLGSLRSDCGGKLAWLVIPDDLFRAAGARFVDADGILDQLLGIREVELCAMFRQQESRGIKATFRSKGRYDVGSLAEGLGGGGRSTAGGVLLPMPMSDAMDCVLPLLYEMLARSGDEAAIRRIEETAIGGATLSWSAAVGEPHAADRTRYVQADEEGGRPELEPEDGVPARALGGLS